MPVVYSRAKFTSLSRIPPWTGRIVIFLSLLIIMALLLAGHQASPFAGSAVKVNAQGLMETTAWTSPKGYHAALLIALNNVTGRYRNDDPIMAAAFLKEAEEARPVARGVRGFTEDTASDKEAVGVRLLEGDSKGALYYFSPRDLVSIEGTREQVSEAIARQTPPALSEGMLAMQQRMREKMHEPRVSR